MAYNETIIIYWYIDFIVYNRLVSSGLITVVGCLIYVRMKVCWQSFSM